jgi:hypothetical protein
MVFPRLRTGEIMDGSGMREAFPAHVVQHLHEGIAFVVFDAEVLKSGNDPFTIYSILMALPQRYQ